MAKGHAFYYGLVCGTREKILINGVPDRLNYSVISKYIRNLQTWPQATKYNLAGWDVHFDSLCGKRSGQFISVLQLKQVACVPELIYVGVML